jgi:hypothetical protein
MRGKAFKGSKKGLENTIQNLISLRQDFVVEQKRRNFIVYNKKRATYIFNEKSRKPHVKLDYSAKRLVVSLFGNVRKAAERYCVNNDFHIRPIERKHPAVRLNRIMWREMPVGTKFIHIDISHCYWRIAYLNGIISENLYKGKDSPEMKIFRNMALACLTTAKSRRIYRRGKLILDVSEDNQMLKQIYENIRHIAYNFMGNLYERVSQHSLGYRIDGIKVLPEKAAIIKRAMKKANFLFKEMECIKYDEQTYVTLDGEIKYFTQKPAAIKPLQDKITNYKIK